MLPQRLWKKRWPNFSKLEIYSLAALGRYEHLLCPYSMDLLQAFRNHLGVELLVNIGEANHRGVRTIEDNIACGGAKESMHLAGRAFDISSHWVDADRLAREALLFQGWHGIGIYKTWVHVDTRLNDGRPITWRHDT